MTRVLGALTSKATEWWSTLNSTTLTIYSFIIGYAVVNFALAVDYWQKMRLVNDEFWFLLARACGMMLNFNCALILLPMCRQFMRLVHAIPGVSNVINVDRNIALHKHVGRIIAILGTVHTFAHYMRVSPSLNLMCGDCCVQPLPQVVPDYLTAVSSGSAFMSGLNVVPPAASSSNGTLSVVLSARTPVSDSLVTFNISTFLLSSPPISILFHAAPRGINTDSFLFDAKPFFQEDAAFAAGRFPQSLLTPDVFKLLMDGAVYVNVRTELFPKGELRAQVSLATPSVDATCDVMQPTTCNVPAWWTRCAGLTGVLVSVVMIIMFPVAADSVRPLNYEFFFNAHHLFVLFYLFLGFHGPNFWKWTCGPVILYSIERAHRFYCSRYPYKIMMVSDISGSSSQVMGLYLAREEFQYKAGQYFFLNCPGLPGMEQEWHPFTISSSPFEDHLSAHISIMPEGSWTRALRDRINPDREKCVKFDAFLAAPFHTLQVSLLIDGPHGAPSQHVFEVDAAILVGAGIGVTPFVSILRTIIDHIWERRGVNDRRSKPCLPKKVLFFWIGYRPEVEAFRWFLEQLALWEKKFDEIRARPENADLFLDIQLYLTLRTAKDAATDYNQLKVDTRQGLVPISDLDAKMIRKAELRRLEGELTQSRSSKSADSRQAEEAGASSANPWDSEAASSDSSGMVMPARRRPSQDETQGPSLLAEGAQASRRIAAKSKADPISGLRSPTMFGRPNWDKIFDDVVAEHNIRNWDVMFCGPRPLKVALEETCRCPFCLVLVRPLSPALTRRISNKTTTRAVFNFHGENF